MRSIRCFVVIVLNHYFDEIRCLLIFSERLPYLTSFNLLLHCCCLLIMIFSWNKHLQTRTLPKDADFSSKKRWNVKTNCTYHCKNKRNECIHIWSAGHRWKSCLWGPIHSSFIQERWLRILTRKYFSQWLSPLFAVLKWKWVVQWQRTAALV